MKSNAVSLLSSSDSSCGNPQKGGILPASGPCPSSSITNCTAQSRISERLGMHAFRSVHIKCVSSMLSSVCLHICLSGCLSVCPSVRPSVCLLVCLSHTCWSTCLSLFSLLICSSIYISVWLSLSVTKACSFVQIRGQQTKVSVPEVQTASMLMQTSAQHNWLTAAGACLQSYFDKVVKSCPSDASLPPCQTSKSNTTTHETTGHNEKDTLKHYNKAVCHVECMFEHAGFQ